MKCRICNEPMTLSEVLKYMEELEHNEHANETCNYCKRQAEKK